MNKFTVLKLVNGQDIIGKYSSKTRSIDNVIILEEPLAITSTIIDNGATIVFLRQYAMLSEDKTISIYFNQIISQYTPQKVLIDYYTTMVNYNKKFVENDLVSGMSAANKIIESVMNKGLDFQKMSDLNEKDYEKNLEYWESLMKTDKKAH